MKLLIGQLIVLKFITAQQCDDYNPSYPELSGLESFSAKLAENVFFSDENKNKNAFISPLSIQYALATLYLNYQECPPLGIDWEKELYGNSTQKPKKSKL